MYGFNSRLASAETTNGAITAVVTDRGERFTAGVFVDASYEGDLLAAANVPDRVGREHPSLYGASLAGRREYAPGRHQFATTVSPFDGDHLSPLVHARPLPEPGTGDGGVMACGYRACLSAACSASESCHPVPLDVPRLDDGATSSCWCAGAPPTSPSPRRGWRCSTRCSARPPASPPTSPQPRDTAVQQVPIATLRDLLVAQGAVLSL